MKKILFLVIFSLFFFSLAQDRTDWPKKLVFGFIPIEGAVDTTTRFGPLVSYLEEELDLTYRN